MGVYRVNDIVLDDAQLWALTNEFFGDLGQGVVQGMFQIAQRESGGQAGIVNDNPSTRDNSWGLWQINIRPDANPRYASLDLGNPRVNAQVAREMFDASGPTPWSTYRPAEDAALFSGGAGGFPPQEQLGGLSTQPAMYSGDWSGGGGGYEGAAPPMAAYNAQQLAEGAARQMYMGGVQGPHAEAPMYTGQPAAPPPKQLPPDEILIPLLRDAAKIWGGKLPEPLDAMFTL